MQLVLGSAQIQKEWIKQHIFFVKIEILLRAFLVASPNFTHQNN
jgi:hypothetical protein